MEKVIGSGEPSGFIMTSDTGDATLMEELLISFKSIWSWLSCDGKLEEGLQLRILLGPGPH